MPTNEKKRRSPRAGVTLIEMLVVVMIIGLFAVLVGPNIFKQTDKARIVAAQTQINNFELGLAQYKLATGIFPTTEQGLQALRVRPANLAQWEGNPRFPKGKQRLAGGIRIGGVSLQLRPAPILRLHRQQIGCCPVHVIDRSAGPYESHQTECGVFC